MVIPETYSAFRRTTGALPLTVTKSTEQTPKDLKPTEVLIRIYAVSLNFRDVGMLNGRYPIEVEEQGIPASDCAAEVVSVGSDVKGFKATDHVAPIFDLNNLTGEEFEPMRALGGDEGGVLRQYAVFDEKYLVHLPKDLPWEEASTIACAGVTAWTALNMPESAKKNKTALLQGTGGVSMFALLICLAANIHPIITSSSDAKLEAIKKLGSEGAISTINYRTTPDWPAEAKRLTGGQGVDLVVNNVGASSLDQDVEALRKRGNVSLVGFLGGFDGGPSTSTVLSLMVKLAKIQGIGVGSKLDFQALNNFLEEKKVRLDSIIDKVFAFEDSKAAFDHLYSGKHTGKVVVRV